VEAPAAERGLTADLAVESEREAERAAPALPPSPLADAREWNVWELERLARRFGGKDLNQDEEWGFLLVYLREFATPEGLLPADFDALVRESFPELVAAVETS
jgi:hypothetical protein